MLRFKRRRGLGAIGESGSVVVPQDPAVGAYGNHPAVLRISKDEAGSSVDHVAVPWQIRALAASALAPGPVGQLRPGALAALDRLLELVLGLH